MAGWELTEQDAEVVELALKRLVNHEMGRWRAFQARPADQVNEGERRAAEEGSRIARAAREALVSLARHRLKNRGDRSLT